MIGCRAPAEVGETAARSAVNSRSERRQQSAAEEIANCVSHSVGFLLAAALLPILVQMGVVRTAQTLHIVSVSIFAATMMLLYLCSALFHGLPPGRGKRFFERLDHAAIYLFIAGSYSPFAVSALQHNGAWLTVALVWILALAGALIALSELFTHPLWSTGLYVAMGWSVLAAAVPSIEHVSSGGMRLLIAGGVVYTLGAALFLLSARIRFAHLAWHLFVMAGSALHVAAAVRFVGS
ncbi:hemolysin III family protein [Piscinibacter sp. XHJ-5]|uniref:PAQR family membrane homeostasis protein TrhA n=1 Tax=Piscinibacter sp. XHJ-5 TaxID=3037797 RepID=UPI00245359D6|nr:hemolysin III family protein [Piscinibacter sp. XHJ-5]